MIIGHIFFSSGRLWQTALKLPSVDCYAWEYQLASFIMCDKPEVESFLQSKYLISIPLPNPCPLRTCGFPCDFCMRNGIRLPVDLMSLIIFVSETRTQLSFVFWNHPKNKTVLRSKEWESLL